MAITIGGAVWLGRYLDEKIQNTTPWLTILFALIGVFAAIYYVIKDLMKS
jgi:F0F1-type ATP synthase assembly protein I